MLLDNEDKISVSVPGLSQYLIMDVMNICSHTDPLSPPC